MWKMKRELLFEPITHVSEATCSINSRDQSGTVYGGVQFRIVGPDLASISTGRSVG